MNQPKKGIFDSPKNVQRVLYFLYAGCFVLFVVDFLVHRHISYYWENIWAFYPIYGFVSCVVLVIIASWMRPFLMRDEGYYNDEGRSGERDEEAVEKVQSSIAGKGDRHVDD